VGGAFFFYTDPFNSPTPTPHPKKKKKKKKKKKRKKKNISTMHDIN
jgi:hypothetical protein